MSKEKIKKAIMWFKLNDIEAYEDDGSVYVDVHGMDCASVQITGLEVEYRADLFDELYEDYNLETGDLL